MVSGFELMNGECKDIDECLINPCIGGRCTNLLGIENLQKQNLKKKFEVLNWNHFDYNCLN